MNLPEDTDEITSLIINMLREENELLMKSKRIKKVKRSQQEMQQVEDDFLEQNYPYKDSESFTTSSNQELSPVVVIESDTDSYQSKRKRNCVNSTPVKTDCENEFKLESIFTTSLEKLYTLEVIHCFSLDLIYV